MCDFPTLKGIIYMLVCGLYSRKWSFYLLLLDYFTAMMAKVLWGFSNYNLHVEFFHAFSSCYWLVTWITTGPSYRHLLYAYKLTTCSFIYMGTSEAGPSSLLWQDEFGKFFYHTQVVVYPIYWILQIVLHVILLFSCIMVLYYKECFANYQ
jgi:hypothetical protein